MSIELGTEPLNQQVNPQNHPIVSYTAATQHSWLAIATCLHNKL